MVTVDQQIETRFAQHEEQMRRMGAEMEELKKGYESLRLAIEGNKALGIKGMVDTLAEVVALARDTATQLSKAKWVIVGAMFASQGIVVLIEKALGIK